MKMSFSLSFGLPSLGREEEEEDLYNRLEEEEEEDNRISKRERERGAERESGLRERELRERAERKHLFKFCRFVLSKRMRLWCYDVIKLYIVA